MRAVKPVWITEAEYLATEASSPEKREYVNGEILAMAGVSFEHAAVHARLIGGLNRRLHGRGCEAVGSDLRVLTAETGLYSYPDIVVVCGRPELSATTPPSLLNPRVLFEILSESTENHDRVVKVAHYRHRATVDAIVLVDSRRRLVEIQTRNANGTWTLAELTTGELRIDVLDVGIPLDEIYDGVVFPALPGPPTRRATKKR